MVYSLAIQLLWIDLSLFGYNLHSFVLESPTMNTDDIQNQSKSLLWNKDIAPVDLKKRNWGMWSVAGFWASMSITIPAYMIGASLIADGLTWFQALGLVAAGNLITWVVLALLGYAGTKYGIPFPVLLRSSFGVTGARLAALIRAVIACGWFGIFTWIGGKSLYVLLIIFFPTLQSTYYLGHFVDLNIMQFSCFFLFWGLQWFIIRSGIELMKHIETYAAPLLIIVGLVILIWAVHGVASFKLMLLASYKIKRVTPIHFWHVFGMGLGAVVAGWIAVAVNIPDFTRYVKTQKDQIWGQLIGLLPASILYAFIGITVTSATILLYGTPIWDPIDIIAKLHNPFVMIFITLAIMLATLTTNIGANIVAAANDFSNLWPKKISFKIGGYITSVIGVMIFPWKLLADPNGYILHWLLAYTVFIGALGGVMIGDFFVVNRTHLDIEDLFRFKGRYLYNKGWNWRAFLALIVAVLPSVPGILATFKLIQAKLLPYWVSELYDFNWLISFGLAFLVYWLLMKSWARQNS